MNHLFDRKTDAFFGSLRFTGYFLVPAGIILGGSPWWSGADKAQMLSVGALLFLLGVLFQSTYHGFQIDFKRQQIREYLSMFWVKTGKWSPLPNFQQVVLTSNLGHADPHDHDHEHEHHHDAPAPLVTWYTIGLHSQAAEADFELRTDNQQEAWQTVQLLAQRLGIEAIDRTSS